jgi:hypothetical protein
MRPACHLKRNARMGTEPIASWSARTKTYCGSYMQSAINSVKEPASRGALRSQLPVRRNLGEGELTLRSFSHFFELLIEHPNAIGPATADGLEAIDGDVKPVALFAFHNEVSKT